jgi:hypothetical protein
MMLERIPRKERKVRPWLWYEEWCSGVTHATTEPLYFRLSLMLTRPQSRLEAGQRQLSVEISSLEVSKSGALTASVLLQVAEAVAEWAAQQQIYGQALRPRSRSRQTTTPSTR